MDHKSASKPYPDYPLYPHRSGKWAKKIKGKTVYFGRLDNPDGALAEYQAHKAKLDAQNRLPSLRELPRHSVLNPPLSLRQAADKFCESKRKAVERGELRERTLDELRRTSDKFCEIIGPGVPVTSIGPDHFTTFRDSRAATLNVVSIGNEITRIRSWFKFLHASKTIKSQPDFGPDFRKPSARILRRHRKASGKKLFAACDILSLIDEAGTTLRAMIYLGINCAFGPGDCANLPVSAIDLQSGWIDFPRPKTEVDRLCPLWPETIDAMNQYAKLRSRLAPDTALWFVDHRGRPWSNDHAELSKYFSAVRRRVLPLGGMYWLRHTFATVAGESKDQVAVNAIMGHVDPTMAAVYREEISRDRLVAVTNTVRDWLYAGC
jgi:integrase